MKIHIRFTLISIAIVVCDATYKSYNQGKEPESYTSDDISNNGHEQNQHNKGVSHEDDYPVANNRLFTYQGQFEGLCGNDGFYYNDHGSFVICSNNNAYVQPCAPGSRNSGFDKYNLGDNYFYRDFCAINLVDRGYGVKSGNGDKRQENVGKSFGHAGSGYGHDNDGNEQAHNVKQPRNSAYKQQYIFHGKYQGQCGKDGFYYRDQGSFIICSNNNAYEQPCAPGSQNSAFHNYKHGDNYLYRDFCDINLVDQGYGVNEEYGDNHHDQRGY